MAMANGTCSFTSDDLTDELTSELKSYPHILVCISGKYAIQATCATGTTCAYSQNNNWAWCEAYQEWPGVGSRCISFLSTRWHGLWGLAGTPFSWIS